ENWCGQNLNHPLTTMADLNAYFLATFGNFGLMLHSWWVPRYSGDPNDGGLLFPTPEPGSTEPGWPRRLDDSSISLQPIMTDKCQYVSDGGSPDVNRAEDG